MREMGGSFILFIIYLVPVAVFAWALLKRYTFPAGAALSLGTLLMGICAWYLVVHVRTHSAVDWGQTWPVWAAVIGGAAAVVAVLGSLGRITRRMLYLGSAILVVPVVPQMFFFFPGAAFFLPLGTALLVFLMLFDPRLRLLPHERIA